MKNKITINIPLPGTKGINITAVNFPQWIYWLLAIAVLLKLAYLLI